MRRAILRCWSARRCVPPQGRRSTQGMFRCCSCAGIPPLCCPITLRCRRSCRPAPCCSAAGIPARSQRIIPTPRSSAPRLTQGCSPPAPPTSSSATCKTARASLRCRFIQATVSRWRSAARQTAPFPRSPPTPAAGLRCSGDATGNFPSAREIRQSPCSAQSSASQRQRMQTAGFRSRSAALSPASRRASPQRPG